MIKKLALVALLALSACAASPAPQAEQPKQEQAQEVPPKKTLQCFNRDAFAKTMASYGVKSHVGLVSSNKAALYEVWLDNAMNHWVLTAWPTGTPTPVVCVLNSGEGWMMPGPTQTVGD